MNSKTILVSLTDQELKNAFFDIEIAARLFEVDPGDLGDPQVLYYCLGEITDEWATRPEGATALLAALPHADSIQKAATLDALATTGCWQAVSTAEEMLQSKDAVLRRASADYLFKRRMAGLTALIAACQADPNPSVRVGIAMQLFTAFRQSLGWLEEGLERANGDDSELVRSISVDELGTFNLADYPRVHAWIEESHRQL